MLLESKALLSNNVFHTNILTLLKIQSVIQILIDGCLMMGASNLAILIFTITAEIHARSLVNFYRQYADSHMNSKFM